MFVVHPHQIIHKLLLIEKDCFKFTLKVYNNGNKMDIKASWREIKNILLGRDNEKSNDEKKRDLSLFGGGLHVHFHISINPTFMSKEKEEE